MSKNHVLRISIQLFYYLKKYIFLFLLIIQNYFRIKIIYCMQLA